MSNFKRCYETHPTLDLGIGVTLYGGSCLTPMISHADIYVGLEHNMAMPSAARPWRGGCTIGFPIPNMKTPTDPKEFVKLVDWLGKQLLDQKEVHVGCIGGHGRTGMVLSALKYVLTKDDNATEYIREHYCKKAVETVVQVDFLHMLYDIKKVPPVEKYKDAGFSEYIPKTTKKVVKGIEINHLNIKGTVWN